MTGARRDTINQPQKENKKAWRQSVNNQSINQSIKSSKFDSKRPHEHKRSHIPAQPHGQQTTRSKSSKRHTHEHTRSHIPAPPHGQQTLCVAKRHTGLAGGSDNPTPARLCKAAAIPIPIQSGTRRLALPPRSVCMYMYVKIRRHQHQHTRVHAHTGPRRHARAPACRRHHIPRLVRRQAFHTDHHR